MTQETITFSDEQLERLAQLIAEQVGHATTEPPLLDAAQVAERLALPRQRVWELTRRGALPVVRISARELRYRPADIEAWIRRRTTTRPKGTQ
jgi:predicted DNA-binding transcriptional regulator AlpA